MQHLVGTFLPDVNLPTSFGTILNPAHVKGRAVYVCYPYSGRPNVPNPPNWDNIEGAHGSTPQILAFAKLFHQFEERQIKIFGLNLLSLEWNTDFSIRNSLPFPLLSDEAQQFSTSLDLPRFSTGGSDFLQRITLSVEDARITKVLFPISVPEKNAVDILTS
jgi:peroxiredoxin